MVIYEIIGYSGSLLIAISLLMSNILRLRIINCIGAVLFSTYGLLIKAPAVFLLNAFIAIIDIYYIFILETKKNVFKFIETNSDDKIFRYFISSNLIDIKKFFPEFDEKNLIETKNFLILRNLVLVGIFIYKSEGNKAKILVDYVTKEYRDLKNARAFLNSEEIKKQISSGIKEFYIVTKNKQHIKYLKKIDFKQDKENKNIFFKEL